jgi:hypothetical protein
MSATVALTASRAILDVYCDGEFADRETNPEARTYQGACPIDGNGLSGKYQTDRPLPIPGSASLGYDI